MKKSIFVAAFALVFAGSVKAQLLWKISGGGLEKPSYVIGSHHLANVSFIDKIAGVKDALTETDQVYGEVDMGTMTDTEAMGYMQKAMMLPEGQTLKDVLTPGQYQKLDKFLAAKLGVGFSSPEVANSMGKMKPYALATQLIVLTYMMNHMGEFDPSTSFDMWFQAQAKANKEPVGFLEDVKFQADLLYSSQPMERQAQLLECFIDHNDYQAEMLEKITKAFYAQDLDALKKASDEKIGNSCDSTPEENAALVDNRNADWLTKMPKIMKKAPTFFVMGALHLPGEKGVLQLLKNAGYTVEPVK
ncbi:MAG: TraB/GumN family protein [Prevotella sp.]|nr:TraB/GumN family protein [Prevotella sp.]